MENHDPVPGPGEYSKGEQRFINCLCAFTVVLIWSMLIGLVWKAAHADFTAAIEHSERSEK
jgi:hypothetical protein